MTLRKWIMLTAISVCGLAQADRNEWIRLNGGNTFCRSLTPTTVMRDNASCGRGTVFCTTPIQCFGPATRGGVGTVFCKATREPDSGFIGLDQKAALASSSVVAPSPVLTCPNLQKCADDPNPELGTEQDLLRWSGFRDDDIIFFTQRGGMGTRGGDHR